MANNTYPIYGNMLVTSKDLQATEDAAELAYAQATTKDGIFNSGIIGEPLQYVTLDKDASGNNLTSFSIKAFTAITRTGKRIELEGNLSGLYPSTNINDNVVPVTYSNYQIEHLNIPTWFQFSPDNFTASEVKTIDATFGSLPITSLNKGAILHGARLKISQSWANNFPGKTLTCSIGTDDDPELVIPKFNLLKQGAESDILTTANTLISFSNEVSTDLKLFFESDTELSKVINGSIEIHLCLANISPYSIVENEDPNGVTLDTVNTAWPVQNGKALYWLVARHIYIYSEDRSIRTTKLTTQPFKSRKTDSVEFRLLRRAGAGIVDEMNVDDILIAVIETTNGLPTVYSNVVYRDAWRETSYYATQYLTIPSYRIEQLQLANEGLQAQINALEAANKSQNAQVQDLYKIVTAMEGSGLLLTGNLGDISQSVLTPTSATWQNPLNNVAYPIRYLGTRLLCNGQYVPIEMYSNLFSAIGTQFNLNDDGTTDTNVPTNMFKLPNYTDVFLRGTANSTLVTQIKTANNLKAHQHSLSLSSQEIRSSSSGSRVTVVTGLNTGTGINTTATGNSETYPDFKHILFYIEAQKAFSAEK